MSVGAPADKDNGLDWEQFEREKAAEETVKGVEGLKGEERFVQT